MIDFINPRSKTSKFSLSLTLASLVILGFGSFVTFNKFTEYYTAKKIAAEPALPSGDYLLQGGFGKHNEDIAALLANVQAIQVAELDATSTEIVEAEPIVAGIQYDEQSTTNTNTQVTTQPAEETKPVVKTEQIPDYNMIVIPKMGVKAYINEGATADTLSKGIWRMPQGATPNEGGNTIITAHRYLYRPPSPKTFFLIDKMVVGDTFYIYWEGKRYDYRVRETKVVEPSEVSILHNTPNNQITLFSCTPLFTSDQRLVVIADEI